MRARGRTWTLSWARFRRARKGSAAVEFALVAFPFFLLIAGMAEVTLMGFAQSSLDFAVQEAGRRIRTGEMQTQGLTSTQVRDQICQTLNWLIHADCAGTLFLDVDRYQSFADVNTGTPLSNNGQLDQSQIGFNPGAPSDIIMVRAYFEWPMMTPFFQKIFANMPDGKRLISSAMLFRNEPFPAPP